MEKIYLNEENKFKNYIIDQTNYLLENEEYETIEEILEDIQKSFNLIYNDDIKELYNKYSIDILEYYIEYLQEEYGAFNSVITLLIYVIDHILTELECNKDQ